MTESTVPAPEDLGVSKDQVWRYFKDYSFAHMPEMRMLFRDGALWSKDKWGSAARHSFVVGVVANQLAEMTQQDPEVVKEATVVGLIHDHNKRKEIEVISKAKKEGKSVVEAISQASLGSEGVLKDRGYASSIGPLSWLADEKVYDLERKVDAGDIDPVTMLLYYADGITSGSDIVSVDQRMAGLRSRYPDLDKPEGSLGGRSFLGVQEAVLRKIEVILAGKAGIEEPSKLPETIVRGIADKIKK